MVSLMQKKKKKHFKSNKCLNRELKRKYLETDEILESFILEEMQLHPQNNSPRKIINQ